jgi:hypothetical protein
LAAPAAIFILIFQSKASLSGGKSATRETIRSKELLSID